MTRRVGVGIAAAALFLFVGQMGLDPREQLVFYNSVFFSLYDSPSYTLGLVLFLATLIALRDQLEAAGGRGGWVLLAILLVGCAGTKAAILPVLLGGLVLYGAWQRFARRDRDISPLFAAALVGAVFLVTYVLMYRGESGGLAFHPPGSIKSMAPIAFVRSAIAGAIGHPLFWLGASVFGVVGFCGATLAGIPAALASKELRGRRSTVLALALLIASFGPFFALTHKGGSQNFFTYYGLCAACIVSALGLAVIWDRLPPGRAWLPWAFGAGWLALLLAAATLPYVADPDPPRGALYGLWIGLPVLVAGSLLVLAARLRPHRALLQAMATVAVLAVGLLDTPLHTGHVLRLEQRTWHSFYSHDSARAEGLTPDLQRALAWVRRNVPVHAVIAVNNVSSNRMRLTPDYYYYSAFGERRVFLEGWIDTIAASGLSSPTVTPFPARLALVVRVFGAADLNALQTMRRRYGVDYLLVDRVHSIDNPRLARLARPVFANAAAVIYRVA